MLDLVVLERWPGFVRQAEIFRPSSCMLSRLRVCLAAGIAKVPLITAPTRLIESVRQGLLDIRFYYKAQIRVLWVPLLEGLAFLGQIYNSKLPLRQY